MNGESENIRNFTDNSQLCRLCSSKRNLIDLFSESVDDCNIYRKLFVYATGIEIKKDDIVSKMVCQSCCEVAIKLHKYRTNALTNDKLLKVQKTPTNNQEIHCGVNPLSIINAVQHFNLTITKELNNQLDPFQYIDEHIRMTEQSSSKISPKINYHTSIKKLLDNDPHLIISDEVCTQDVLPVVTLNKADVTKWYEEQIHKVKQKLANITIKKLHVNTNDLVKNRCAIKRTTQLRCPANRDKRKVVRQGPKKPDNLSSTANNKTIKTSEIINAICAKADELNPISTSNFFSNDIDFILTDFLQKNTGSIKVTPYQDTKNLESNSQSVKNESKPGMVKNKRSSTQAFSTISKKRLRTTDADSLSNFVAPAASRAITSSKASDAPEFDSLFIINSSKSVEVFVCPTCSLVCESKKMLVQHQKTHLSCQTCKIKFKSVSSLEAHVIKHCTMSNIKDNAVVKLVRVDSIPSIIEQYSETFQSSSNSDEETNRADPDTIEYFDYKIKCENDVKIEMEHLENNGNDAITSAIDIVDEIKSEPDFVCISDDSDNDIEFSIVSTENQSSVRNRTHMYPTETEFDITNKSFYYISKLHTNEDDMLKSLYKKHYVPTKVQNYVQTFKPCNKNVKCTINNIIVLQHMYTELLAYRVPIYFENRPKIGACFSLPFVKKRQPLEYWGHKKIVDIKKVPVFENNLLANVISSDLPENGLPFKIVDVSTDTSSSTEISKLPVASSSSSPASTKLNITSSLQKILSNKINLNQNALPSNLPAPVENMNLNKISISNSPLFSLASGQDLGMLPTNGIIINSLPSSSGQSNLVLNNNLLNTQLNNIILVSNQVQPILCNSNFSVPLHVSTSRGIDIEEQNKGCQIEEIIDVD